MSEIVKYGTQDGGSVFVEVSDEHFGTQRVARRDGAIIDAGRTLEDVVAAAKPTINAVLGALHGLAADEREIEFGLKLTGEAGVVVAKTAVEGHFTVKLCWRRPAAAPPGIPGAAASAP
jgi:NTP-dependent ternary system trypsin peptidase co-occuring protein